MLATFIIYKEGNCSGGNKKKKAMETKKQAMGTKKERDQMPLASNPHFLNLVFPPEVSN